jgi:hypothetical protein
MSKLNDLIKQQMEYEAAIKAAEKMRPEIYRIYYGGEHFLDRGGTSNALYVNTEDRLVCIFDNNSKSIDISIDAAKRLIKALADLCGEPGEAQNA